MAEGIDMDKLQPELTDIQKLYVAMASVNTALNDVQTQSNKDHRILVEGNGDIPLVEKVRNIEAFVNGMKFWMKTIAVAIVLQTLTFGTAAVVYFVRLYPILQKIAAQDIIVK